MEKKKVGIVIFIIGIMLFPVAVVVPIVIASQYSDLRLMWAVLVAFITPFVGILVTIIGLSIFLYYRSRENDSGKLKMEKKMQN